MMSQMHIRMRGHPVVITRQQSNRPVDVLIHAHTATDYTSHRSQRFHSMALSAGDLLSALDAEAAKTCLTQSAERRLARGASPLTAEQATEFTREGFLVIDTPQISRCDIEWCRRILMSLISRGAGRNDGRSCDLSARDGDVEGTTPQLYRPSLYAPQLAKWSYRKVGLVRYHARERGDGVHPPFAPPGRASPSRIRRRRQGELDRVPRGFRPTGCEGVPDTRGWDHHPSWAHDSRGFRQQKRFAPSRVYIQL